MPDTDRMIPNDPLGFIKRCFLGGKVLWTYHVQMRLRGRSISRAVIFEVAERLEIIESYPDDKYLPSYLVYASQGEDVIHVLIAADVAGDNIRVVTAYRPNPNEWESDLRIRRGTP